MTQYHPPVYYKVTAVIKPFKLDEVKVALNDAGIEGITVCEAKGFGKQRGHTGLYRDVPYVVDFIPKVKVEVALASEAMKIRAVDAIKKAAYTGRIGDGLITVEKLDDVRNIRTEDRYIPEYLELPRSEPKAKPRKSRSKK